MQQAGWTTPRHRRAPLAALALALFAAIPVAQAQKPAAKPAPATTTLDRIKQSGHIKLGYRSDAAPFSYQGESGKASGYSVALCQNVADAVKTELGLSALSVDWVPVTLDDRFAAVQKGDVDLLCGADTRTLGRMKEVAFSIPIFPGGIGALVRTDAASRLKEILSGAPHSKPNWRAEAGQLLQTQNFAVVPGTTSETWLTGKLKEFQLTAKVTPVDKYDAGVAAVLDRKANVFFADRAILLDATQRNSAGKDLLVVNRYFTYEPVALAFARGDADFRLVVDRTLSRLYASPDFKTLYGASFGTLDENALAFFRWNILPE